MADEVEPAWSPVGVLAHAVYDAGFKYHPTKDIIYSRQGALQRHVGFCWAYDCASAPLQMIIDCETIYFPYDGKLWLIELWKGQYGFETGCEIGVYRDDIGVGLVPRSDVRGFNPRSRFYKCVTTKQLRMQFHLYKNNKILLERGPEHHYWLTGFKWGEFTQYSSELSMDAGIWFHDSDMRNAFANAATAMGYTIGGSGTLATFTFGRPFTEQPGSRHSLEVGAQQRNSWLVDQYNLVKFSQNIRNNDPNSFQKIDALIVSDATKILDDASAAARKIGAAAAKTLRADAATAAKRLGKAAGEVKSLQHKAAAAAKVHVSDDVRTAHQEILAFIDKKCRRTSYSPGSPGRVIA